MTSLTRALHESLLRPLGSLVIAHSDLGRKPLLLDLRLPWPPRLRLYMYSLVDGAGSQRPTEYKAVLRVPGQKPGDYGSFDHSGGRIALLVGYRADLDVFVLWDASLHPEFKNGGNIQVKHETVHNAAGSGRAEQSRTLASGSIEIVIACQSPELINAIDDRVAWTGGVSREWAASRS